MSFRVNQDLAYMTLETLDPGDEENIRIEPDMLVTMCKLLTTGAETRTLGRPTILHQMLTIVLDVDGGNCVLTVATGFDQAGATTITFQDAGDYITLIAVQDTGALVWRVLGFDGVAGPIIEIGIMDIDVIRSTTALTITIGGVSQITVKDGAGSTIKYQHIKLEPPFIIHIIR